MSAMRHVSGIADTGSWDRTRAADRIVLDAADRVQEAVSEAARVANARVGEGHGRKQPREGCGSNEQAL